MSAQTDERPAGTTRRSGLGAGDARGEPLELVVDHGAGRVLLRDRGELVGYQLRMRERFGRAFGLGWVELLLADGAVVGTGVSGAEVIAVARDSGRGLEVADISRWAAEQFVASGERTGPYVGLCNSRMRSATSAPAGPAGAASDAAARLPEAPRAGGPFRETGSLALVSCDDLATPLIASRQD